jgi:PIN domain nuclease of toxin-antitoxin system
VSWWDIAARIEAGLLQAELGELRDAAVESGFVELPLRGEHVGALPAVSDSGLNIASFDRMVAAQAESEPLRLISSDTRLVGRFSLFVRA